MPKRSQSHNNTLFHSQNSQLNNHSKRKKQNKKLLNKQYQIIDQQSSKYLHSTTLKTRAISRPRCHSRHVSELIAELSTSCSQRRRQRRHLLQPPLWVLTRHERQQFPFPLRHHQAPTPLSLLPRI